MRAGGQQVQAQTVTPPLTSPEQKTKKKRSRTVKGGKYQNTASNRAMRKAFINRNQQKGKGSASSS
eukprot:1029616-Pyramimonas_sp.AAC.1